MTRTLKIGLLKLSKSVIEHPDLKEYFSINNSVYCEQEIFTESNKIIKPDRLVFFDSNRVAVIDYKTGEKNKKDLKQILKYQKTLENMGYKVEASILVYIENSIDIVKDLIEQNFLFKRLYPINSLSLHYTIIKKIIQ